MPLKHPSSPVSNANAVFLQTWESIAALVTRGGRPCHRSVHERASIAALRQAALHPPSPTILALKSTMQRHRPRVSPTLSLIRMLLDPIPFPRLPKSLHRSFRGREAQQTRSAVCIRMRVCPGVSMVGLPSDSDEFNADTLQNSPKACTTIVYSISKSGISLEIPIRPEIHLTAGHPS